MGSFDDVDHLVGARCYNGSNAHVGTAEINVQGTGGSVSTLSIWGNLPTGTINMYFGDIYPTA